ncbi:MAG: SCO family protein [Burkholderiaceae bacterium]|nr:MAG: SCO family protein [Burkholderiaceae bacterium]
MSPAAAGVSRRRALALLGGLATLAGCHDAQPGFRSLDVSGAEWGRDFHLHDPEGHERSLAEFRGKVVLIFFGFTQCPDVCPTALARAVEVRRALGDDGRRLQVIFVTVDPERDTPAVLRAYLQAFDADFLGLSGDLAQTEAAARDFRIFYQKVPTGSSYTMDHTALSYAFDPAGRLRLAIRHAETAASVAADVKLLLKERVM